MSSEHVRIGRGSQRSNPSQRHSKEPLLDRRPLSERAAPLIAYHRAVVCMEAPKAPPTPSAGGIVRLNIGGVHLCTTAATLLSHGDNFFSGLLSGRFQALTDETGAYFIDRCGRAFEPLLDYLRNGTLIIPPHVSLDSVLLEAQYFLIDISSALSGMLRSGLYSGRNVGGADVAILFVEKDPAFPAQVAVTGVIEGYLCFEHVCPIEQGKVVLRIPSSEFLLQPAGTWNSL